MTTLSARYDAISSALEASGAPWDFSTVLAQLSDETGRDWDDLTRQIEAERVAIFWQQACYGAGADARWAARDAMEGLAEQSGRDSACSLLQDYGLDLATWFASCPISR